MAVAVGVDVGKEFHWAEIKIVETGQVLVSHRVDNDPSALQSLIDEITVAQRAHGPATVGIDILDSIASLAQAMLLEAGLKVVHVPGLLVNRSRRAVRGGEQKSDPRDARVIADQVRMRSDLREVTPRTAEDAQLRLLVGRRRELVVDQTRRIARLRDLLASIHPGLERVTDATTKAGLALLARYVTPAEIRRAGKRRITDYLHTVGGLRTAGVDALVEQALAAAQAQHVTVPGEATAAELVRELAREGLAVRSRLSELDKQIEEALDHHPDAALIRSLPGMGAILTAEFLAETGSTARFATGDQLAAAAGLAPALIQSGKTSFQRRATGGNRALKRVFYQSAFCALRRDPASRAFYDRKRSEGKRHHQAVIALARRRINVLHAVLRTRQPYKVDHGQEA